MNYIFNFQIRWTQLNNRRNRIIFYNMQDNI